MEEKEQDGFAARLGRMLGNLSNPEIIAWLVQLGGTETGIKNAHSALRTLADECFYGKKKNDQDPQGS